MRAQEAPQPGGCRMPKEARKIKQQYRAASRAAGPTHPHFAWSRLNRHHVEVWGITPGHNRPALPAAAPAKAWSQGTPGSTARGKEAEVSGFWILVRGSPFAVCSSAFRPSPVAAPAKAWSPDAKMASLPVSKSLPAMLRAAMQAGPLLPVSQSPSLPVSKSHRLRRSRPQVSASLLLLLVLLLVLDSSAPPSPRSSAPQSARPFEDEFEDDHGGAEFPPPWLDGARVYRRPLAWFLGALGSGTGE